MKRSPTDFTHLFHDLAPEEAFDVLTRSLRELDQKRQVKLKWTKPAPRSLTVTFETRGGFKSTGGGTYGEARCVASPGNRTELQLTLVPAGSRLLAAMSSGQQARDGLSVMAGRGYDLGERQKLWETIIGEMMQCIRVSSPPRAKPESQADERPPVEQSVAGDANSAEEAPTADTGVPSPLALMNEVLGRSPFAPSVSDSGNAEDLTSGEPAPNTAALLPVAERLDLIDRLAGLKSRGHLSEAEFSEQKTRLIYG